MDTVAYLVYIFLCGFGGMVCAKANIDLKDWKYWAVMICIIGAYICGTCQ